MSVVLAVEGLTKSFGRPFGGAAPRVVDDVSFDVRSGRTVAILGESGAGKSTVGRMVVRLVEPDSGSIHIAGKNIARLSGAALRAARADVHMVFQNPGASFNPKMRLADSISEPLWVQDRMKRAERRRRAGEALRRVGLDEAFVDRWPHELSGGQLQRASIARALVTEPKLIVFDESVAALDVSVQAQILNLLLDVQAETGVSYLFITHDISVARSFADDVVVMKGGRVIAKGSVDSVFQEPTEPYVSELMAAVPKIGSYDGQHRTGVR